MKQFKIFKINLRRHPREPRNSKAVYQKQPVYSYSQSRKSAERPLNRGEDEPQQLENQRSKPLFFLKISNFITALLVVAGIIYISMLSVNPKIKFEGALALTRNKAAYETAVKNEFKSSWKNYSKLTFNSDKTASNIQRNFPEIQSVDIATSLLKRTPTVKIIFAEPAAKLVMHDKEYILDQEGRAVFNNDRASSNFSDRNLIVIIDSSEHQITLGKPALTEVQIQFLQELIGQAKAKGLSPESFALSSGGTAVDVKFAGVSYKVKFSFYADAKQSSGAYFALREQLKKDSLTPSKYVDLRIPDRAYIR